MPHEVVSILESEKRIMKTHFGNPRQRSENNVLDARLRSSSHCNRVAIAAQTSRNPEDVNFGNGGRFTIRGTWRSHKRGRLPFSRNAFDTAIFTRPYSPSY